MMEEQVEQLMGDKTSGKARDAAAGEGEEFSGAQSLLETIKEQQNSLPPSPASP